jgi:hypothetical protein
MKSTIIGRNLFAFVVVMVAGCVITEVTGDSLFTWLGLAPLIAFAIFCFIMQARENKFTKVFLAENARLIDKEL